MRSTRTLHTAGILLCLLLTASAAFPQIRAREEFHRTFVLGGGAAVTVENVNGNISIAGWDSSYADVRAVKTTTKDRSELAKVNIEISLDSGLRVKSTAVESRGFLVRSYPSVNVEYTIRVPASAVIQMVQTVNGDISLVNTQGTPSLTNTNGAVKTLGVRNIARAKTTNGSIEIVGAGNVSDASTTNGSIRAGVIPRDQPMNFSSVNGSIALTVAPGSSANVDIRTVNGKITVPDGFALRSGEVSKRNISGRLGAGGAVISAKTVNGDISLKAE
jgi:DUF4097 and DUF4098 domain-containing protein YvlB